MMTRMTDQESARVDDIMRIVTDRVGITREVLAGIALACAQRADVSATDLRRIALMLRVDQPFLWGYVEFVNAPPECEVGGRWQVIGEAGDYLRLRQGNSYFSALPTDVRPVR